MFGRKSSYLRRLENQLEDVKEEVEQNVSNNSTLSDDLDNAYTSVTIANNKLRFTKHDGNHDDVDYVDPVIASVYQTSNQVDTIVTGKGYQTANQVDTIVTGKGYQTANQVDTIVTNKGYQTANQVDTIVTNKGYQTANQVNTIVNNKGYQTANQVDTIVTNKGYQTASQVNTTINGKGYQTANQVDNIVTSKGYQTSSDVQTTISNISSLNLTSLATSALFVTSGAFDLGGNAPMIDFSNYSGVYIIPDYRYSRNVLYMKNVWIDQGLHINGSIYTANYTDAQSDFLTNGGSVQADPPGLSFGLVLQQSIVCDTIVVTSDERIKDNIRDIDDGAALEQLRLIQPKIYGYKDKYLKGNLETIGYIAQEVRNVIPQAVTTTRRAIPNVLKPGRVYLKDDKLEIKLTLPLENDITPGVFLRVIIERENERNDYEFEVISSSDTLIVVSIGTERVTKIEDGMSAVVYGEMVDNFHVLDEAQIFTIATASVQELDRQLQAEKAKTAQLQAQMADVISRLIALEKKYS